MAELLASMPLLPLTFGCMVKFEAINPTTGAAVAGVTISTAQIYATDAKGEEDLPPPGPFMLVPGPDAIE